MKKNMGIADRGLRIGLAAILGLLCYTRVITGAWAFAAGTLAVVFLLTSAWGFCPLYRPFRINTRALKNS